MINRFISCCVGAVFAAAPVFCPAQNYPTRPITFIVPFTPGSGIDIVARTLGPKITERWSQPVIVDNRAGASGNIGSDIVAKANPDGHTLMVTVVTFAMTPGLYRSMPYDPVADFTPVAQVATGGTALTVNPVALPVASMQELVAAAKARPGQLNYASPGNGTPQHLGMELLEQQLGIDLTHVPYKGASGAMTDLLGGQVQIAYLPVHTALPHAKGGKLRVLAVAGDKRSVLAPDSPSFNELGYKNMNIELWFAIYGPAKLPPAAVQRWERELPAILALPDVKDMLGKQGLVPHFGTSAELAALTKSEVARWREVVQKAGIKPD